MGDPSSVDPEAGQINEDKAEDEDGHQDSNDQAYRYPSFRERRKGGVTVSRACILKAVKNESMLP